MFFLSHLTDSTTTKLRENPAIATAQSAWLQSGNVGWCFVQLFWHNLDTAGICIMEVSFSYISALLMLLVLCLFRFRYCPSYEKSTLYMYTNRLLPHSSLMMIVSIQFSFTRYTIIIKIWSNQQQATNFTNIIVLQIYAIKATYYGMECVFRKLCLLT